VGNSLSTRIEVDQKSLGQLFRALKKEADGKEQAKEFTRRLREIAKVGQVEVRASLLSMPSHSEVLPSLRATVVRQVRISVRTTGKHPRIVVYVPKTGPRGFSNAPHHLNSAKGWRHPVHGNREKWVHQLGKPGWFDDPMRRLEPAAKGEIEEVLKQIAVRIDERSKV
jgi:hypothetical protein